MDPDKGKIFPLSYEEFKQANGKGTWNGYLLLTSPYPVHCFNCKLDADKGETGIDCGGDCPPCNAPPPPPSCTNCTWDSTEGGIDCGESCPSPCEDVPEERIVYANAIDVLHNGKVFLWDCIAGVGFAIDKVQYKIYYSVYYCNGNKNNYAWLFTVQGGSKSSTEESEEPEAPPQFSPPDNDDTPLESETSSPHFSIIPNPNSGVFHLETNFYLSEISNLKISNLLGVTVFETQNVTEHTLQLQNSASGVFFVVMILKDGTVIRQKMVIQR